MPYVSRNEYEELLASQTRLDAALDMDPLKFAMQAYMRSEFGSPKQRRIEMLVERMLDQ